MTDAATQYDVFLSHNSADKPAVEALAQRLVAAGFRPFLDRWHLIPGQPWQEALEQALDQSRTCVVFLGPNGVGPWENEEMRIALDERTHSPDFRVIPVLLPATPLPERGRLPRFLSRLTWVDFREGLDDTDVFYRLTCGIRGIAPGAPGTVEPPAQEICPYRGLQAFQEEHADIFFGRSALIQWLVEGLRASRFLAVIGPSGSGKSSVVRAGLVPALRGGALPGSAAWTIITMKPGVHPLEELAARFAALPSAVDRVGAMLQLQDNLRQDARALHTAVRLIAGNGDETHYVLVIVDQFEEVFTLCQDETERRRLLDNLLYASGVAQGRTVVVLTMRADFYARAATYAELADRLADHQVLITPMQEDELRQVIEAPAKRVGLSFDAGLVDTILADVAHQPGGLPLLEHALLELWERRLGHQMTFAAYREIGGVEGAIARRAEQEYDALTPEQQVVAQRILLRLVQPGEGTVDTRRRARLDELAPDPAHIGEVEAVVQRLADARLLTTGRETASAEEMVDVAHEALIQGWPRLRDWIERDREALRTQRRLADAALEWQRQKQDESYLYRGARLATAAEWAKRHAGELSQMESTFLDASLAQKSRNEAEREASIQRDLLAAQQLAEEQRKRADEKARSAHRLRILSRGLVAVTVLAVLAAVFAALQYRSAKIESRVSTARQLAAQSLGLYETEVDTSLLLAVEAYQRKPHDLMDVSGGLLAASQCCSDSLITFLNGHTDRVWDVAFSPDGKELATSGDDGKVIVWDVATRRPITALVNAKTSAAVYTVAFSPTEPVLAAGDGDGSIVLRDSQSWQVIGPSLVGHDFNVHSLKFSQDGSLLISGGGDGKVVIWDMRQRQQLRKFQGHTNWIWDVAISPDNQTVASVGRDNTVRLWSMTSTNAITTSLVLTRPHATVITSVTFNDDPEQPLMLTGDVDGNVVVWDMRPWQTERQKPIATKRRQISSTANRIIWGLAFIPGKDLSFASSSSSGTLRTQRILLADDFSQSTIEQLKLGVTGHNLGVFRIDVSPDGKTVAAAGQDKLVSLWSTDEAPNVLWHNGEVNSMRVLADGVSLTSVDVKGNVFVWDYSALEPRSSVVLSPTIPFSTTALSADGRLVATGGADRTIRLWDAISGELSAALSDGHQATILSLAFSPDRQWLASGDENGDVTIWEVASGKGRYQFTGQRGAMRTLLFSPDGATLVGGGCGHPITFPRPDCGRGAIYLWNVASGERVDGFLPEKSGFVWSMAFNPANADDLAVGTRDGVVTIWSLFRRNPRLTFILGGTPDVNTLAFSPDGKLLAVGIDSYKFSLYDALTGQKFGRFFKEHDDSITQLAFSPDGSALLSASLDSTIVVHDMRPERWLERACQFANRSLTPPEQTLYLGAFSSQETCNPSTRTDSP